MTAMIRGICCTKDRRNTHSFTTTETWHEDIVGPLLLTTLMVWQCPVPFEIYHEFPIPESRKPGRPKKTWSECVNTDVTDCGLAGVDAQDMHGEPIFDIAWSSHPHIMGHGQHLI